MAEFRFSLFSIFIGGTKRNYIPCILTCNLQEHQVNPCTVFFWKKNSSNLHFTFSPHPTSATDSPKRLQISLPHSAQGRSCNPCFSEFSNAFFFTFLRMKIQNIKNYKIVPNNHEARASTYNHLKPPTAKIGQKPKAKH